MSCPTHRNSPSPQGFRRIVKCVYFNALTFILLIFVFSDVLGQDEKANSARAQAFQAAHVWVNPLHLDPLLSGNFGELRGNHFHTGVDLKTAGVEGLAVLAATDGWVSRVKMSPWGYGNALYLEGPDGITTVYAHLQRFSPEVQQWATRRTYENRTLGLDATPPRSEAFTFSAGDTLGWSGNSGGSGGPHLHFEVRDTPSQHPLNPLDGWLSKVDSRPPSIPAFWLEAPDGLRKVALPVSDTVKVPLRVRFSVEAYDLLDGAGNVCGVRNVDATLRNAAGEEVATFGFELDELDFSVNKDMNAHTLFPVWHAERDQVHRLHKLEGNRLGIYRDGTSRGWVELSEGEVCTLSIDARDAAGNASRQNAVLLASSRAGEVGIWLPKGATSGESKFEVVPGKSGQTEAQGATLSWQAGTVFEAATMSWDWIHEGWQARLDPSDVPLRKDISVRWPVPKAEGQSWAGTWAVVPGSPWPSDRWLAVRNLDGQVEEVATATWNDSHWTVSLPEAGDWTLMRDTVPPRVLPYFSGTPLVASGDAVWFVEDELAGVDKLSLSINGEWARLVWDPKRNMVTYEASDALHPLGVPCLVRLVVTDEVGNETVWERSLAWP
jgi:hypothetical protein